MSKASRAAGSVTADGRSRGKRGNLKRRDVGPRDCEEGFSLNLQRMGIRRTLVFTT